MRGATRKLLVLLAALVAAVLVLTEIFAESALRQRELARIETDLEKRAVLARELFAAEAPAPERLEIDSLADRLGALASARVTLLDGEGAVLGDSEVETQHLAGVENHARRPEVAAALRGEVGRAVHRSRTVGRDLVYVAVPAAAGPVRAVRVAADLAELDRSVSALRRTFAAAGALALASALAISALLVARSLRSLGELREVVDSIARGELDRRLRWRSGDEREEIAQAINRMADELRRRLREADGERGRLQAVLSGMFEGVLVVGADGRVVLANPSFRRLFSVWGDVAGRTALELVRHPAVDDLLREAALSSETLERELEVGSPTGQASRSLLVHAARFPEQGERLGTLAVFHDVTEIRRLEGLRRDFVANVSHELKTPLTAIRGFAETLAAGDVPPDRVKGFVGIILRHAERLERLIDDLLVLSRVESRKLPLDLGPVDVARVAVSVVRGMEPQLGAHRVTAEVRSDGAPAAWADRRAVEQILTNLVDNAVKYSEPGGRIQIEVEGEPQHVTLRVRDSGIGIPDEDQPRVFERFYRVDKARSRDLGGTGLGLAIVKHLAQAMGGDASVKSRLGEGSTFRVALPRADRRPQAASH